MAAMKTPGVYILEKNAFPNSVVEAPTAIPAFVGITEKAMNGADSLIDKPWKISSMTDFNKYFGGAPQPSFMLSVGVFKASEAAGYLYCSTSKEEAMALKVKMPETLFTLYYNMVIFFANGGSTCYIVSVGTYEQNKPIDKDKVGIALTALTKEQEVTMMVIPEATNVEDCKDIQQLAIKHCGEMKNRFAIFDVQPKKADTETLSEQILNFQTNIGSNYLSYGAVYYPWLNTSVLSDKDIDGGIVCWDYLAEAPDLTPFFESTDLPSYFTTCFNEIKAGMTPADEGVAMSPAELLFLKNNLHNVLLQNWGDYKLLVGKIKDKLNRLPPSATIAGIYTMVDNTRGVWKAPANVSVNYVNSPTEMIDNNIQGDLNMPMNGKAVNAIRTFIGEGIKVWGARTLDGNSQDWRYVNVRRTMLYLEESVKNASKAYVFEPNESNTWVSIKSMIDNFLRSVWKRGGLAGSTPEEAFEVHVGLGDTMTSNDILDGIMRITVLVAITRPAEFIEITFQQQVQKS